MKQHRIFDVYEDEQRRIFTLNLTPGKSVYEEKLVLENNKEYREWNPKRSKLAAAILKGCNNIFIRKGQTILYLGCSTGTTASHVSDIVGKSGIIFAIDIAPRVMRELVFLSETRKNIAPILADANRPEKYSDRACMVDVIYQDIAQRNQIGIFLKNINIFLNEAGYAIIAVKARSIDVTKKPGIIFQEVRQQLEKELTIIDEKKLEPYQLDHCMFICKKKK